MTLEKEDDIVICEGLCARKNSNGQLIFGIQNKEGKLFWTERPSALPPIARKKAEEYVRSLQ